MRYPQYVQSTIKGGVKVTLGRRTVLVGANGSGKSAVVQAIELSSRGYVTDTEGRERVSDGQTLARLFPSECSRTAQVTWSDGSLFSWNLPDGEKSGSFKRPNGVQPFPVAFPIDILAAIFAKDSPSIRSWMEEQVFGAITLDDVKRVAKGYEKVIQQIHDTVGKADFLGLAAEAKSQARSLRTRATREEGIIEQLTAGLAMPLMGGERKVLEAKVAALSGDDNTVTQEQYDLLKAEMGKKAAEYDKMTSAPTGGARELLKLKGMLEEHSKHFGTDTCLVCGHKADLKKRLDEVEKLLAQVSAAVLAEKAREALRQEIEKGVDKLKTVRVAHTTDRLQRRELEQLLHVDAEATKGWTNAQAARLQVNNLRMLANEYEQVSRLLDDYGRIFLHARKSAFEEKVTAFLAAEGFGLDLDASRVGMRRGQDLHTALSGVEEARVFLALGAALGFQDALMVPRDRAWDPKTLTATMEVLSKCEVPILIMSTVMPDIVEGWAIVEL